MLQSRWRDFILSGRGQRGGTGIIRLNEHLTPQCSHRVSLRRLESFPSCLPPPLHPLRLLFLCVFIFSFLICPSSSSIPLASFSPLLFSFYFPGFPELSINHKYRYYFKVLTRHSLSSVVYPLSLYSYLHCRTYRLLSWSSLLLTLTRRICLYLFIGVVIRNRAYQ